MLPAGGVGGLACAHGHGLLEVAGLDDAGAVQAGAAAMRSASTSASSTTSTTADRSAAATVAAAPRSAAARDASLAGEVSGRRTMATSALTNEIAAARKNGTWIPALEPSAPRAGPATNPTPKAAPRRPMSLARWRGGARSAAEAWATDTEAPLAPSRMRAANRRASEPASPVSSDPMAVPNRLMIRTGLRPTLSDRRPQIGAKTSWASENEATSTPMTAGVAPKLSAYCGRIGRTMPKPTRSTATVDHRVQKPLGSGSRSLGDDDDRATTTKRTAAGAPGSSRRRRGRRPIPRRRG